MTHARHDAARRVDGVRRRRAGDAAVRVSELVSMLEAEGLDHRSAIKRAAKELGLSRDEAYRRLVAERGN